MPLAIYLAVETGMRLQEIFNLTWLDVDTHNRRIEIRKSKTDYLSAYEGRTVVLTLGAEAFLVSLRYSLQANGRFKSTDKIFPVSKDAFKQSWSDVCKRADINNLTFHDLRREAGSRFDEAGLTKGEHDLMMGHANKDMTSLYIHADLKSIQDKLDRYVLGGLTLWETIAKKGAIEFTTTISGKPKAVSVKELAEMNMMRFESEEEMNKYVERWSEQESIVVPFPGLHPVRLTVA